MPLTVDDLKPKNSKIKVKGVEVECKPLRLSHALAVAKIGNVFQDPSKATKQQIKEAESEMDDVITELMPELAGIQLDIGATLEVITQMMEQIEPSDNKELNEKGVSFDTDPKA